MRRTRPNIKTKYIGNAGTAGAQKTRAHSSPPTPPQPTTLPNSPYGGLPERQRARQRRGGPNGRGGGGSVAQGHPGGKAVGGGQLGALVVDRRLGGGPLPSRLRRRMMKDSPASPSSVRAAPNRRRGRNDQQIIPAEGADGCEGSGSDV